MKNSLNRPNDFVARYGGEEFSIILPETDERGAAFVAETLRSNVEGLRIPHENSKVIPVVTISVGVATVIPDMESNYELLIERADNALYKAKKSGRNKVYCLQHT